MDKQQLIENAKKHIEDSDPSLAIYMLRDQPWLAELGLSDLAWAMTKYTCSKREVIWFFDSLEKALQAENETSS